ncbi:MAG: DNRLRE domain-containing protein [Gammaproteobacteria bacterium]|nr:DNRLRE domain-containing protein [Gammaproteobacteria bacterium]
MNKFIKSASCAVFFVVFSTSLLAQSVTRGPYLQMQTGDSITIHWRTDTATDSEVRFGLSAANLDQSVNDPVLKTDHAVTLIGLSQSQKYWYAVGDSSGILAGDASYHFHTAPTRGQAADTRIWVIGDSGTANADARSVRDAYKTWTGSDPADFWIMLGDNAYNNGTDSEYQAAVFNTYPEILRQLPLWSTLGNHDGYSADSFSQTGPYYDIFNLPTQAEAGGFESFTEAYYSFDYANIHFICLDSYDTDRSVNGSMLQWLQADLAQNTQPWIIAFWHHPPYTKGSHNSDTEGRLIDMRQNALPILEQWGVDLVLSGHSHSYERSYLLDGHYGMSGSLDPDFNILDPGDGNAASDGAYEKPDVVAVQNAGAVYAVAGSSGKISGGALNHPAMLVSLNMLGSLVVDVAGNRMDVVFLNETGSVQDEFTILKTPDQEAPLITAAGAQDATHVIVDFNEPLDSTEALNTSNYSVDGLSVNSAELLSGDRSVRLTTSNMSSGSSYTLVVNNLQDLVLNTIQADSQVSFEFHETMTVAFQEGLAPDNGYAGTSDAYIREASATTAHGLETSLQVDGDEPAGSTNDMNILLRWDTAAIPVDAIVESVAIQLAVTNPSNGSYTCYGVLRDWNEATVTWNQAGSGTPWGSPGAEASSDRDSAPACTVTAGVTGTLNVGLNEAGIALVQSWVNDPAGNHGLVISDSSTSDGADFHSSESSTAMARPRLEVTYRVPAGPVNISPVADYTFECTGLDCDFTDASSDSDGLVASWSWNFGDGNSSNAQSPSHSFAAAGDYVVELTVTDDESAVDSFTSQVSVSEPPTSTDQFALADLPSAGTVSGSFTATHSDDSVSQTITERESGGKKNRRHSYLSHTWRFSVQPGSPVTLHANAWSGGSSDGDTFRFEWSENNLDFFELFIISNTAQSNMQSGLIAASGTIYIRVTDTDQTSGNRALDTVYIDQLYIRSDNSTPQVPPGTPTNLSATGLGTTAILLTWERASDNEQSFDLERAPAGSMNWTALPSPGAGSTSYTDSGLSPATSYDYRIRARNSAGASAWSATASGSTTAAAAISLTVSGYKVKGKHIVDLSWSGATGPVDIIRNETVQAENIGGSSFTDNTGNKGGATYVYRVCEVDTGDCSDDATVVF